MMPRILAGTTQPANVGSPPSRTTSIGSPSSACVPGTKPKSNGNEIPSGSTLWSRKEPVDSSNRYLLRLPAGVSTTTFTGSDFDTASGSHFRAEALRHGEVLLHDRQGLPREVAQPRVLPLVRLALELGGDLRVSVHHRL